MNISIYTWLAVIAVSLVIEGGTNALIAVWFAISGLVCLVLALVNVPVTAQIIVFVCLSAALMLLFYKKLKEHLQRKAEKTNTDALIGKTALVEEEIKPGAVGRVKVGGISWSAYCPDIKGPVCVGGHVTILAIEGVKLRCEPSCTESKDNFVFENKA